jgi:hypothetical protein
MLFYNVPCCCSDHLAVKLSRYSEYSLYWPVLLYLTSSASYLSLAAAASWSYAFLWPGERLYQVSPTNLAISMKDILLPVSSLRISFPKMTYEVAGLLGAFSSGLGYRRYLRFGLVRTNGFSVSLRLSGPSRSSSTSV